jgi:hypothetical protein
MAKVDQAKEKKKVEQDRASRPVSKTKLELHTIQAQRVFERNFSIINAHMYSMLVMPLVYQREDVAETARKEIQGKLEKIAVDMKSEKERIEKLKTDNGITLDMHYSNPKVLEAEVTTPASFIFIQLLQELDNIIKGLDLLWMGGIIDDTQKNEGAYQWQRRLVKFAGQIRQLEALVRKGLKRQTDNPEGEAKEPKETAEKAKSKAEAPPKVAAAKKVAMA